MEKNRWGRSEYGYTSTERKHILSLDFGVEINANLVTNTGFEEIVA